MGTLSQAEEAQLKAQLQDAVVACNERCLYQSAKWYVAETVKVLLIADVDKGRRIAHLAPLCRRRRL